MSPAEALESDIVPSPVPEGELPSRTAPAHRSEPVRPDAANPGVCADSGDDALGEGADRGRRNSEWRRYRAFDSLTFTSCVRDLPLHETCVDIGEPGSVLHRIFDSDFDLPGVLVMDREYLVGMISREYFFELLGRPFGVEIYMNRPVTAMLDPGSSHPLVLDEKRTIGEATRSSLERPGTVAYEPVVVRFANGAYRTLNARVLVLAQSRLLSLSHAEIRSQLQEAADFVHSLLPQPMLDARAACDWLFVPSEQLGGDAFGYHWLDQEHLAIYLLDVSGHGTGPAFLSVSALNVLQNRGGAADMDFHRPEEVLMRLNQMFFGIRKRKKGRMFITIWYGVYHAPSRELRYASAGHPPAFLFSHSADSVRSLRTPSLALGIHRDFIYGSNHVRIDSGDRLFVFSDGAYEVMTREGRFWTLEEFQATLARFVKGTTADLAWIENEIRARSVARRLPDDLSLVSIHFDAGVPPESAPGTADS